jgi:hypothetical protein
MSVRYGKDAKLYVCSSGIGGTPVWTELKNVKNVTLNLQKGEADVSTRGSDGWKIVVGAQKEGSVEFEMVWDDDADGFLDLEHSFFDGTLVGIAAMNGDIDIAGSKGLWADCEVINFSRDEPLGEAVTAKITVKPTYSANTPRWKTIGAAAARTITFAVTIGVDGTANVDLIAIPLGGGETFDATGTKVSRLMVDAPDDTITITPIGNGGYSLGAETLTVPAGLVSTFETANAEVINAHHMLNVAGTAGKTSTWTITLETPPAS